MSDTGAHPTWWPARRPLAWRHEARRQWTRRRTLWAFGLLLALPLILVGAFALGEGSSSSGAARLVDLAQDGAANFTVFTLFGASDFLLVILAALFAGDTVPAEASWSSLRYLLTAPVTRTRLLTSKLVVAFGTTMLAVVALPAWSLLVGGIAYGWQPYGALAGGTLEWSEFLPRLLLAVGYIVVSLTQVIGIAFLVGILTDAPLGAVGGAVLVTIGKRRDEIAARLARAGTKPGALADMVAKFIAAFPPAPKRLTKGAGLGDGGTDETNEVEAAVASEGE